MCVEIKCEWGPRIKSHNTLPFNAARATRYQSEVPLHLVSCFKRPSSLYPSSPLLPKTPDRQSQTKVDLKFPEKTQQNAQHDLLHRTLSDPRRGGPRWRRIWRTTPEPLPEQDGRRHSCQRLHVPAGAPPRPGLQQHRRRHPVRRQVSGYLRLDPDAVSATRKYNIHSRQKAPS